MSQLRMDQLSIGHSPGHIVASGICLEVEAAEIVALVGPSGSGKSTLLSTIAGILPVLAGTIEIAGLDASGVPIHRRRVGMVFQEPLLFDHLSVQDNVAYGLRRSGATRAAARSRALELLEWVGLDGLGGRRTDQLSGGQAQRVALARTLAPAPEVVLLDEPFSALDADLRERLAREVAGLLRERGVAAIHVTHDLAEASAMADRVVAMGEISRQPA